MGSLLRTLCVRGRVCRRRWSVSWCRSSQPLQSNPSDQYHPSCSSILINSHRAPYKFDGVATTITQLRKTVTSDGGVSSEEEEEEEEERQLDAEEAEKQ